MIKQAIRPSIKQIYNGHPFILLFVLIRVMFEKQKKESLVLADLLHKSAYEKTISFPLSFEFLPVDLLSKEFTKLNNNHAYRIHYLGFRPLNTSHLHKKYSKTQKASYQYASQVQSRVEIQRYSIDLRKIVDSLYVQEKLRENSFYTSNVFYRAFEGMNPTINVDKQYVFNSVFQAGNLDCAIKIKQTQFDLFLRIDSNAKSHLQWFYFSIKNGQKKQKIKLNICNLSKSNTLYQHKMKPYVFSKRKSQLSGVQWTQNGVNLGLQRKQLRYEFLYDKSLNLEYYCLQIQYEFQYQNDEVFFAYCVPYTYSKLMHQIKSLPQKYTNRYVLGKSLAGIDIPLLHITDHECQDEKKNVLVTGRMHPGQSNSSYMLQGFIHFITSNSKQAALMRKRINFYIIPMVNPDGVVLGNSRTSVAGKDLNRQFLQINKDRFPEVYLIRQFASKIHSKAGIFMYLDFHGHSRKKNTFFYGPAYGISEPNYYKSRIFPKMIEKINSNFRFHSCSFNIDEEKKKTARASMFEYLKIAFTYTIQTSIGFYYDSQNFKTCQFKAEQWNKMGFSIAEGLHTFVNGYEEYQELLKQRRLLRQKKRPPTAYAATADHFLSNLEFQSQMNHFKRGEPLKIIYNDKTLFGSMIDQIKKAKTNNFIKQIDEDIDSDDYDQQEDLQMLKMRQFNNLLAENSKKWPNNKISKKELNSESKTQRQKLRSQHLTDENLEQELKFFIDLDIKKKPSTSLNKRQKKDSFQDKLMQKISSKKKSLLKTQSNYKNSVSSQNNSIKQAGRKVNRQFTQYFRQKIVSETRLSKKQQQNKTYCGQLQLNVDLDNKILKKNPQRHSIFLRENKEKTVKNIQNTYSHENKIISQFSKDSQEIKKKSPDKMQSREYLNQMRPAHYEFKFDNIASSTVSKERLREYFKAKANKATRNCVMGPASFYGIRQSFNSRLSNKRKYMQNQKDQTIQHQTKDHSIKIINFS